MRSLNSLTRRASTGTLAALAATLSTARFAQAAPDAQADRAAARAKAVTDAAALNTKRKFQEAIDLLMPFAGDDDPVVLNNIGSYYANLTLPANRKRGVEWISKAIALKPNEKSYYSNRAGVYGDLGYRYDALRLDDRRKAVALSEAASPSKTATAGEYADLASVENTWAVPRGGGPIDRDRVDVAIKLRSKAIDLDPLNYARYLDRAELINSRVKDNPGAARDDVDMATFLIKRLDLSVPSNMYAIAQYSRRVANLPTDLTLAGFSATFSGISTPYRPSQAQLRNQAITYYSQYIDLFEGSGRDYGKYGSGIGSYENRASVYRSLGGVRHRDAIKDQETLLTINPNNYDYVRNIAVSLDALDERITANSFYQRYLEMVGTEDPGDVASTLDRLRQ